jgi:phosphatidylserine/phosphatidylglycerophosphate/cardiolipin synthase-like enzyme
MPQFLTFPGEPLTGFQLEGFGCQTKPYTKITSIKSYNVTGDFIAYASPDSTYAVTKRLFDLAKKEILIGIYDFSADYIKELLLNARERNVKVTLMLDVDSTIERDLFAELSRFGCKTVSAPCCRNTTAKYFPNCHEKFIIIDNEWLLVQSGNYSKNSIPFNEEDGGDLQHFKKGNRDMGVAINSKELCAFFKKVLLSDIALSEGPVTPESLANVFLDQPLLVDFVPQLIPSKLFKSKTFTPASPVKVQPVLSPDNYLDEVTALLASANTSILIENQYIRSTQPEVTKLMEAISKAKTINQALDVRIILGKLFSPSDVPKEQANVDNIKAKYGLKLDTNIRYIDTKRFVHCHNKLIVVDGETVLISSQNWSDTAVSQNREAGLILYYPDIAKYYAEIFESDWTTASKTIPVPAGNDVTPETLAKGNYTQVSFADYQEV